MAVDVLPSLLLWAPELHEAKKCGKAIYVDALEFCKCAGEPIGYYVQHYETVIGAYGQAFGPFAFDQVLRFCRRLKGRLVSHSCGDHGPICLTTSGDPEDHTNAVVLLGAYLILVQNWTAQKVAEVLGDKEANRKFPCSWAKVHLKESTWLMKVRFCWQGLEVALREGWIDPTCLQGDDLTESVCEKYRTLASTYDAAWIVPGKILVSADPVTTMCDPNPSTFEDLWAEAEHAKSDTEGKLGREEDSETSTKSTEQGQQIHPGFSNPIFEMQSPQSPQSVETVCKDYVGSEVEFQAFRSVGTTGSIKSMAYASFVKECGVSLVIRANYSDEPGMPEPSYDAEKWKRCGISHRDIQFPDVRGGLPPISVVESLLATCEEVSRECPGAVNIHCKGGFGRSVVLCCCLAIHDYNVPGSALLGWVRIVRPGAITTSQQEAFLMSFEGRADILKYFSMAQTSSHVTTHDGTNVGCCSLQ